MSVTVTWDGAALTPADLPLLKTVDAALRLHAASPPARSAADRAGMLAWRPPYRFLPEPDAAPMGTADDWRWACRHADVLGVAPLDAPSGRAWATRHARILGARHAACTALALAAAAHMARTDRATWADAMLETRPMDYHATAHPHRTAEPLAAWRSRFADPHLAPGVSGPGLAVAFAHAAWEGRWGVSDVARPDGGVYHIPPAAWTLAERLGVRGAFTPDPDW